MLKKNINLSRYIDHTNLSPIADRKSLEKLCMEAIENNFKSVCIAPCWVDYVSKVIGNCLPIICTVIGFPLGYNYSEVKAVEALKAKEDGATEFDMVGNLAFIKMGEFKKFSDDVRSVVDSVSPCIVKVIIETALLTEKEIALASKAAVDGGALFVKTSTGFSSRGASLKDIEIIKSVIPNNIGIKASGGIKDYDSAMSFIEAGATRIGTSSGVDIVQKSV